MAEQVSAADDHAQAQAATAAAGDVLAALNARIASGDASVTGAELVAAEAQVSIAERLEAGTLSRAQAEQDSANGAAQVAAIEALKETYRSSSADLSRKIAAARLADTEALRAAVTHKATVKAAFARTGLGTGSIPGVGRPSTPSAYDVLDGLSTLAIQSVGLQSAHQYPNIILEPLAPFLSQEVR
jgi:hypothetical protein